MLTDDCVTPEDCGAWIDNDVILQLGMPPDSLDREAPFVGDERLRSQCNTLVDLDVIADAGGLADDHPGAMIDEKMRSDFRSGMNIRACALMRELRDHAGKQCDAHLVEDMSNALERDDQDTRVGQYDLLNASCGRIAIVGGADISLHSLPQVRKRLQKVYCVLLGLCGGTGVLFKAETLFDFRHELAVDQLDAPRGDGGNRLCGQWRGLEESRKEEVHQLYAELVERFLGRQVGAFQVIDSAIGFVGREQRAGYLLKIHGQWFNF